MPLKMVIVLLLGSLDIESAVHSWVSLYKRSWNKKGSEEVPEVKILPEAKRG